MLPRRPAVTAVTLRPRAAARAVAVPALAAVLAVVLAGGALSACGRSGRGSTSSAACGPAVREPLDPASTRHLFPGAAEPAYLTDPPTSGPHLLGNHPTGALHDPIPRPVQVAMLESGAVLVQYRPDGVAPADVQRLEQLAGGPVTVAPNPSLPAPVVATAWSVKQTCTKADTKVLQRFAKDHAGKTGTTSTTAHS